MIYDDNKQKKIIEYLFYIFCIVLMNTVILSFIIQYQVNDSKFDSFIREMDSYIKKTNIMYNDMSIFYNKTPLS
jgi:uncharacterized protein YxeA